MFADRFLLSAGFNALIVYRLDDDLMVWWVCGAWAKGEFLEKLNSINLSAGAIQIDRADEMNDDTLNRLGGVYVN